MKHCRICQVWNYTSRCDSTGKLLDGLFGGKKIGFSYEFETKTKSLN